MNSVIDAFLDPIMEIGPKIPGALLNLGIGFITIVIVTFFLKRFLRFVKLPKPFKGLIIGTTKVVLWAVLIMFVLNYLGLSGLVVALSGSAVILGFILNNGLSQTISDTFSGIALTKDKDFKIGNKVSLDGGKIIGTVISLGTRKVKLVDDDNNVHIIPNSMFDKNEWAILEERKPNEGHKSKK